MKTPIVNTERDVVELKARVAQLEHALAQNDDFIVHLFNLPPALANLFGLLLTKPFVSTQLAQYEMKVVAHAQVSIHRLRARLSPLGIEIHTRRKIGWYLDDVTKERVRLWIARPTGADNGKAQAESPAPASEGEGQAEEEAARDDGWDADGYDTNGADGADGADNVDD
jgi:hypothetical protein